jgi:hypothetical protein
VPSPAFLEALSVACRFAWFSPSPHECRVQRCREAGNGPGGTMTALVLGSLLASAKGAYDAQSADLTQLSANFVLLDRVLAH